MAKYKRAELTEEDDSVHLDHLKTHVILPGGKNPSIWETRSLLEKFLLLFTGFLIFMILLASIIIAKAWNTIHLHVNSHSDDYCVTPTCIHAASTVLESMDLTADPCNDFYQYSCGGWVKKNPIPDGKSTWGKFQKLWEQNQMVIKIALERKIENETKTASAELKAQKFYQSCMDKESKLEKLGAQPLVDLLEKIGGWSISPSKFDLSAWSLQTQMQVLHNDYNMGGFFQWAVGEDERNSTKHVLQIDQGGLTLPTREYYLNESHKDVRDAYLEYMVKIGTLLGAKNESKLRDQMTAVLNFEIELAKITAPAEDRRDDEKLYHSLTLKSLQALSPAISWYEYFNHAFHRIGRDIHNDESIIVYAPEYLKNMSSLVDQKLKTDEGKLVLNNYLVWHTAKTMTCCLSKAFSDAEKILRKAILGSDGSELKWRQCVSDTNNNLGFAVGAMFVREAFHEATKPLAQDMVEKIRKAFQDNLANLDWMDDETRLLAKEKAAAITDMIAYPDFILDPVQLNHKYENLTIQEEDYFGNNVRVSQFSIIKNLEKLDKPVNKTKWGMTPPTVNAYYSPTSNQMVIPAGILQAPFFHPDFPPAINYGGIGVVIGHEATHGFDDQGREYDKNGNMNRWWENATIDTFNKQTECVVQQYSSYKIENHNVNGRQTLGENIADNGGLKAAFHAYQTISDKGNTLPGLNITNDQLFFVSFAQVWCSASLKETTILQLQNDPHVPAPLRVKGSLSNMPEFSKIYNCPINSPLNPIKKCTVW